MRMEGIKMVGLYTNNLKTEKLLQMDNLSKEPRCKIIHILVFLDPGFRGFWFLIHCFES